VHRPSRRCARFWASISGQSSGTIARPEGGSVQIVALTKRKIRPAWRYTPGGILWRVFPSHPDVLVGEERDVNRKETTFFCLGRRTGKPHWEKRSFGEKWWIGIESVGPDVVYLHRFVQPDMPGHRGIIAVDLRTGEELWREEDLTLERMSATGVIASRMTLNGREEIALDTRTGNRFAAKSSGNGVDIQPMVEADIDFPDLADGPLAGYPDLLPFHDVIPPLEVREGPLEFLQVGSNVVMSYHERGASTGPADNTFRHLLLVGDRASGVILFRDTVAANATGIVPDSFFVQDGMLFYVRERKSLIALALSDTSSPA
jgi:hypothetical protein